MEALDTTTATDEIISANSRLVAWICVPSRIFKVRWAGGIVDGRKAKQSLHASGAKKMKPFIAMISSNGTEETSWS
jgi:hypothetical protein